MKAVGSSPDFNSGRDILGSNPRILKLAHSRIAWDRFGSGAVRLLRVPGSLVPSVAPPVPPMAAPPQVSMARRSLTSLVAHDHPCQTGCVSAHITEGSVSAVGIGRRSQGPDGRPHWHCRHGDSFGLRPMHRCRARGPGRPRCSRAEHPHRTQSPVDGPGNGGSRLREELVRRVQVARVEPYLGRLAILDVEHQDAIVVKRLALALPRGRRKDHGVLVVRQDVVKLDPERPYGTGRAPPGPSWIPGPRVRPSAAGSPVRSPPRWSPCS